MKSYHASVGVRGDCLYCPLSLFIDSYWNCLVDCHHCYMRRLNRTWGSDLRLSDPEEIERKLHNGLSNPNPKTTLAWALKRKKTLRLGNKTDPYQPVENKHQITRDILKVLIRLRWTFVIQTHCTDLMERDEDLYHKAHGLGLLTLMPVISPGGDLDWEVLERKRTSPIPNRLQSLQRWIRKGWNVGVNGEPFIPGYHTPNQFQDMIRRLRSIGVPSYNTYNLHLNDYVAKRLAEIGLDIVRIWRMNQDSEWSKIQVQLCQIAKAEGIRLGCPDFVNTGPDWRERANTCCGINVPRPNRFTTHTWKRMLQRGVDPSEVERQTWEGIGDPKEGHNILTGQTGPHYTMRDAKLL